MDLKINLDIVYDDNFDIKKSAIINIELPNKDLFYAFEAWLNLSRISGKYVETIECIDESMNIVYGIVEESISNELGLTKSDFINGLVDVDDIIPHDENNASAIVTIYVKRKK